MKKALLTTFATTALLLAGCSSNEEVASTEAGRIREDDLYEAMKNEPLEGGMTIGETVLQKLLIEDIFENEYGDEVTDEDVDNEFAESAEQFGGAEEYEEILEAQGMDPEVMRENIRLTLLMEAAIEDKVEITDEDLEEAYEAQKPVATVQHILVDNEEEANEIIDELDDGADFGDLVEEHTQDPGSMETEGVYSFTEGEMMPEFEEAALDLDEGETTDEPVETEAGFHIIRRLELEDEDESFEDQRDELEEQLLQGYTQDEAFMTELIGDLADDANVQISDDELAGAMSAYMEGEGEEAPEDEMNPEMPEEGDIEGAPGEEDEEPVDENDEEEEQDEDKEDNEDQDE